MKEKTILIFWIFLMMGNLACQKKIQVDEKKFFIVSIKNKIQSQKWLAKVSAYSSRKRETDDTPCIAADTSNICHRYKKGELICAAGDRNIPFGTKINVPGYGTCVVADRMNKRYDGTGRVDIYLGYNTKKAYQWGVKKLQVERM